MIARQSATQQPIRTHSEAGKGESRGDVQPRQAVLRKWIVSPKNDSPIDSECKLAAGLLGNPFDLSG